MGPLYAIIKCTVKGIDLTTSTVLKTLHTQAGFTAADGWEYKVWERELTLKGKKLSYMLLHHKNMPLTAAGEMECRQVCSHVQTPTAQSMQETSSMWHMYRLPLCAGKTHSPSEKFYVPWRPCCTMSPVVDRKRNCSSTCLCAKL